MAGSHRSNLATLAIIYRAPEAAVLISLLRAHGIPAFSPTFFFGSINWSYTVGLGGIRVLVPSADLETAIALVGDPRELPPPPRPFPGGRLINILLVILLGLVPPLVYGVWGLMLPARARGVYARSNT